MSIIPTRIPQIRLPLLDSLQRRRDSVRRQREVSRAIRRWTSCG